MGNVLVKFQIRPEGVDVDMKALEAKCKSVLEKYGKVGHSEINPVAFGLKEIIMILIIPDQGGVDAIEDALNSVEGVDRAEAIDVRLAFG